MAQTSRIDELKRRVELDPASVSFAALAEEYRRAGRLEEAIEVCRAGLQRHPSYLSARVTLGRALLEIGECDAAEVELQQVVRVAPENLAAIRALAEIHHRRPETIAVEEQPAEPEPGHAAVSEAPLAVDVSSAAAAAPLPGLPASGMAPLGLSTVGSVPLIVTSHVQVVEAPAGGSPLPVSTGGASPLTVTTHVHVHAVADDPALAGLEAFLGAIQRARRALGTAAPR
jgi:tetratricopeptide (TPR) repeat protein